jgi:predicted kinase
VHCRAPEAVLRQRVAARTAAKNDASEAGLDVLQRQPGYWEPFDVQQQSVVVPVDTSDPSIIDRALEQLAHRNRK